MIVGFPFVDETDIAVYNHEEERLTLKITRA